MNNSANLVLHDAEAKGTIVGQLFRLRAPSGTKNKMCSKEQPLPFPHDAIGLSFGPWRHRRTDRRRSSRPETYEDDTTYGRGTQTYRAYGGSTAVGPIFPEGSSLEEQLYTTN